MTKYFIEKNPDYHLVTGTGRALGLTNYFLTALKTRGLSTATVRAYAFDLLVFHRWWLSHRKKSVKNLNTWDLQNWIEFQRKQGARPASINRRLSAIEGYYQFCYGKKIARSNRVSYPSSYYRNRSRHRVRGLFVRKHLPEPKLRVKAPRPLINSLEVDEINRFLGGFFRYRDKAMVLLMLFCGLRASEVLGLKLESIDFENKRVRVWGKGGKERVLPLPEQLSFVLKKYLTLERPEISRTDRFFVTLHGTSRGEPLTYQGLIMIFCYCRNRSGVKKVNPHSFRHAFGTNMARYGVTLPVLQKMMGHTEFKHTMRYTNLAMTDVAEEYSKALSKIEEKYERADIT
jgi:site-specific recombinase XerD